jgi:formate dehydrogenase subunit gamma
MHRLDTGQIERAKAIIDAQADREGAALPILHALQAAFGYIPDETIPLVASALNLSRAEIFGIVGFYHDFRRRPAGRTVVKLCRAEACQSMGAAALADHALARLGIAWHGTTADGAITLEPVYCLGLCATAPAAMANGAVFGRLTVASLDTVLDAAR